MTILVIYFILMKPFEISFLHGHLLGSLQSFFDYFDSFIAISFGLDIILNFNTGFYVRSQLILNRKQIIKNYL